LKSLLTSTTLATLFLLRDSNISDRDRQESYGNIQNHDLSKGSRPTRLPPIFETLVGEIEGIGLEYNKKKGDSVRNTKIRASSHSHAMERKTDASITASREIVWSKMKNRHRMQNLNDEWEGALRWIAGWGLGNNENLTQSVSETRKGRRQRSNTKAINDQSETNSLEGSGTVSAMLDVCVDECMRKKSSHPVSDDRIKTRNKEYIVLSSLGSNGSIQSRLKVILIALTIALAFAYLFLSSKSKLIDSLIDKSHQVSYWLAVVGENDTGDGNKSKKNQQRHKHVGKKGRKKKGLNYLYDHSRKKNSSDKSENKKPSFVPENIQESNQKQNRIDFAFADTVHAVIEPSKQDKLIDKSIPDEIVMENHLSKINDSSPSDISAVSQDFDNKEDKWHVIERNSSKTPALLSVKDPEACVKGKPIQLRPFMDSSSCMKPSLSGELQMSMLLSQNYTNESNLSPPKSTGMNRSKASVKSPVQNPIQKPFSSGCNAISLSAFTIPKRKQTKLTIPTDKQREEASRLLREFQLAQISKLRQKRGIFSLDDTEKIDFTKVLDWMPQKSSENHSRYKFVSPLIQNYVEDDANIPFEFPGEHLSGDELLLSNMLDDDDDNNNIHNQDLRKPQMNEGIESSTGFTDYLSQNVMGGKMRVKSSTAGVNSLSYSSFVEKEDIAMNSDWSQPDAVQTKIDSNSWGSTELGKGDHQSEVGSVWS